MKQQRSHHCLVVAAMLLGAPLSFAAEPEARPTNEWPAALKKKGYAPFLANTMRRLDETKTVAPKDAVDAVSVSMAKGEYISVQLGIYGIAGETQNVGVLITDVDLDVKIREVERYARYPQHFKGKWHQPGYWAPTSTLRLSKELDRVGENEKRAFWITFHADSDAKSGLQEGTIWLMPKNRPPTELKLKIDVRPFELPVARASFGVYFPRHWLPTPASNDPRWLEAIYQDMVEHAQNSVTFYNPGNLAVVPPQGNLYTESLPLAKKVGLIHKGIPCITMGGIHGASEASVKDVLKWRHCPQRRNSRNENII
ncbi:MAG: hypothetical protein CMJ64_12410 [Planctomycetaceae bacterium]|nr:hypothetical protein [Planctomycetaceae bacterium]